MKMRPTVPDHRQYGTWELAGGQSELPEAMRPLDAIPEQI